MTEQDVLSNSYDQIIIGESALFVHGQINNCNRIDLQIYGGYGTALYRSIKSVEYATETGWYKDFTDKRGLHIRFWNISDDIDWRWSQKQHGVQIETTESANKRLGL